MKDLYNALSQFQGECPTIEKNKKSHFGKYADLTAILEAIRPLLSKHGLCVIQALETLEDGQYIVNRLGHKSGDEIVSKVRIDYKSSNVQQYGSLISYMRRYSLSSILGIVSDDDVDDKSSIGDKNHDFPADESKKPITVKPISTTLNDIQIGEIETLLNTPDLVSWFDGHIASKGYTSLDKIESKHFAAIIDLINKKKGGA